jgi:hypothetical protein
MFLSCFGIGEVLDPDELKGGRPSFRSDDPQYSPTVYLWNDPSHHPDDSVSNCRIDIRCHCEAGGVDKSLRNTLITGPHFPNGLVSLQILIYRLFR